MRGVVARDDESGDIEAHQVLGLGSGCGVPVEQRPAHASDDQLVALQIQLRKRFGEDALMPDPHDPGYWAVTRRADIVTVSRNNEVFRSGSGVMFENIPVELLEASQSFLAMDPPRHTKLRKVVSAAFTPRQVRRIEDSIKANAQRGGVAHESVAGEHGQRRARDQQRFGAVDQ